MPASRARLVILGTPPNTWDAAIQSLREIALVQIAGTRAEGELLLPNAEIAVLVQHAGPWLGQLWDSAQNLRWIQTAATGVDDLLFPALRESSVLLTNSRGTYAPALAEFVMFCILFFARNFPNMDRTRRERRWEACAVEEIGWQILGIVGLGGDGFGSGATGQSHGDAGSGCQATAKGAVGGRLRGHGAPA